MYIYTYIHACLKGCLSVCLSGCTLLDQSVSSHLSVHSQPFPPSATPAKGTTWHVHVCMTEFAACRLSKYWDLKLVY